MTKCRQMRKTMRQKGIKAKEETVYESLFTYKNARECLLFLT